MAANPKETTAIMRFEWTRCKGKRIKTRVTTSEKSVWTFTERKTRSDALDTETKRTIFEFWLDPNNSRPSCNKNDIKRVRLGPKLFSKHPVYLLEKTQTEVFSHFQEAYPNINISQRTFERLKPYFIRAANAKDRITCCCRYHVEARSLFTKCMDFRKRVTIPNCSEDEKNAYPIYDHLTEIARETLCKKSNEFGTYSTECLERKCDHCGVKMLSFSEYELSSCSDDIDVKWEKYEYTQVAGKRKLVLVQKTTKPGDMFNYFKKILEHFPSHQFRATWQNEQFKQLKKCLPENHCLVVHDYSENFQCKDKVEVQSSYFQRTKVSIHVSVIYRHSLLEIDGVDSSTDDPNIVTEHFFVISPDEIHDQHFTNEVQCQVKEYLDSIGYNVTVMHEYTDGCAAQYRSRHCMGMLSNISNTLGYDTFIRNYFETSHAKGVQDAAGGYLKNQLDLAIFRGNVKIQNAHDAFVFCEQNLQCTKSDIFKRRIFRYVGTIDRTTSHGFKPIPGIRSTQRVSVTKNNQGQLFLGKLSCYTCDNCLSGEINNCSNPHIASEAVTVRPCNDTPEIENNQQEDETQPKHLVSARTIVALYTDEDADYYIFEATGGIEVLQNDEKDAWGMVYRKGASIIRGNYFTKINVFRYRRITSKQAIVPADSVIFICHELNCLMGYITLPETLHLDILAVMEDLSVLN